MNSSCCHRRFHHQHRAETQWPSSRREDMKTAPDEIRGSIPSPISRPVGPR